MGRHCFVPKCTTNYETGKSNLSLFKAPKDPVLRAKWKEAIARIDKDLSEKDSVCELHFEKDLVIKEWSAINQGLVLMKLPVRARLAKDAVPSIFSETKLVTRETPKDCLEELSTKNKMNNELQVSPISVCESVIATYSNSSTKKTEHDSGGLAIRECSTGTSNPKVEHTLFNATEIVSTENVITDECLEGLPTQDKIDSKLPFNPSSSCESLIATNSNSSTKNTEPISDGLAVQECPISASNPNIEPIVLDETETVSNDTVITEECLEPNKISNDIYITCISDLVTATYNAVNSNDRIDFDDFLACYDNLTLPSELWAAQKHITDYTRHISFYECGFGKTNHITVLKEVIVSEDMEISVYVLKTKVLCDMTHAEPFSINHILNILMLTNSMKICSGGPTKSAFPGCQPEAAFLDVTDVWRHKKCNLLSNTKDMAFKCDKCTSLFATLRINMKRKRERLHKKIIRFRIPKPLTERPSISFPR